MTETLPVRRGTSNRNVRGNTDSRRKRREWLVATYRADVDIAETVAGPIIGSAVPLGTGTPACRCFRCGVLMTVDTLTIDRIIPGCQGGTYRRDNIRPACLPCNSTIGATTRRK